MTDYELYQLLDENGYEPSEENLACLKEDADLLNELFGYALTARGVGKQIARDTNKVERLSKAMDNPNLSQEKKDKLQKKIDKRMDKIDANNKRTAGWEAREKFGALKRAGAGQAAQQKKEDVKNSEMDHAIAQRKINTEKLQAFYDKYKNKNGGSTPPSSGSAGGDGDGADGMNESFDIIANLLESNGFEVSVENIVTLCESIVNDECAILDSTDVILTEGMDPDYVYMQILDNNDFEVSENNIAVLKEAIDNGHILLA